VTALRIGTRGSPLALWQANTVARLLSERGVAADIITFKTSGDRLQERPLSEQGGKGLFVKELEDALLSGAVDLAVHSAKDMSAVLPAGLRVSAVLPREDSRDALVLPGAPHDQTLESALGRLGNSPSIGTGSVRRSAQLASRWTRARFAGVRGNVDTRLRKLDSGEFDALILAVAGLKRLGHERRVTVALDHDLCIPAPGQGIVAVETREDAPDALRAIDDASTAACFTAERALVAALGGGCQLPLGAVATHRGAALDMRAVVISPDGRRRVTASASGDPAAPAELGARLAEDLANGGAIAILNEVR
jgi:hydroxymethylbilane synthase